jgi:anti-sigma regulatory factor (Ser/Thr protein kinase)
MDCNERTGRLGFGTTMTSHVGQFEGTLRSVRDVRRFVGSHLSQVDASIAADIVLMASELATNAICHGGSGFELILVVDPADGFIRVDVRDEGGGKVVRHVPGAYEGTGRGLQIVDQLSDRWGWCHTGDGSGKSVWFEVNACPSDGALSLDLGHPGSQRMVVSDGQVAVDGVSGSLA